MREILGAENARAGGDDRGPPGARGAASPAARGPKCSAPGLRRRAYAGCVSVRALA